MLAVKLQQLLFLILLASVISLLRISNRKGHESLHSLSLEDIILAGCFLHPSSVLFGHLPKLILVG